MKTKTASNWIAAMLMVSCFMIALAAPDLTMKLPAAATVGYLASFGFLCFAVRFLILVGRR